MDMVHHFMCAEPMRIKRIIVKNQNSGKLQSGFLKKYNAVYVFLRKKFNKH